MHSIHVILAIVRNAPYIRWLILIILSDIQKEWMGCLLDDFRVFGIDSDKWTIAPQDEGDCNRTAKQAAEIFMAK